MTDDIRPATVHAAETAAAETWPAPGIAPDFHPFTADTAEVIRPTSGSGPVQPPPMSDPALDDALKTADEWQAEMPDVLILDADGWRGGTGRPWGDPISRDEYLRRRSLCTISGPVEKPAPPEHVRRYDVETGQYRRYDPQTGEWTEPPAEIDPAVRKRMELIAGLHALADWYQEHPEVPLPAYPDFRHCVLADSDLTGLAELAQVANALGVAIVTSDGHHRAKRLFAGLEFQAYYVSREELREHADDQKILATVKAAAKAHLVDAEDLRRQLLKAAGLDGPATAPTARTGAAIPPTPVDPGSLQDGTGPGHQDAGDGQGTRPAGAGGKVPAPATAPIELDGQDHADAIRITDTPGQKLPYRVECDLHTDWSSAGDGGGIDAAVAQHIVDTAPPTRRGHEVVTYGHPCIDVPPGVRVLGDPDYGQTKRTS